jgi:hypothetical protein
VTRRDSRRTRRRARAPARGPGPGLGHRAHRDRLLTLIAACQTRCCNCVTVLQSRLCHSTVRSQSSRCLRPSRPSVLHSTFLSDSSEPVIHRQGMAAMGSWSLARRSWGGTCLNAGPRPRHQLAPFPFLHGGTGSRTRSRDPPDAAAAVPSATRHVTMSAGR